MPASVESLAVLNRIRIKESEEPLVHLHDYVPSLHLLPNSLPLARREVAVRLACAHKALPKGYGLALKHALRTFAHQQVLWNRQRAIYRKEHPEWPPAILVRETNKCVAPCHVPTPPGHCTGGALDVFLTNEEGTVLMEPMPPYKEDWTLGHTFGAPVPPEQQELRNLLYHTMVEAGFSNYPLEYWHYSYGDSAWAARNNRTTCPYGIADPSAFQALVESIEY